LTSRARGRTSLWEAAGSKSEKKILAGQTEYVVTPEPLLAAIQQKAVAKA